MSVIEQVSTPEVEAEIQDAAAVIGQVGIQLALLADEADDPVVMSEITTLQSKREAAEDRMAELIRLQREQRLGAEAEAARAEQIRLEHLREAVRLGGQRVKDAQALDAAFSACAQLLKRHEETSTAQANSLYFAGGKMASDIARPKANRINNALRYALMTAGVDPRAIDLPNSGMAFAKPLLETDPVAIDVNEKR